MVRRILSMAFFVFWIACSSALASSPTDRRDAFEFAELCIQRVDEYNLSDNAETELKVIPMGINNPVRIGEGSDQVTIVSTSLAHLYLSADFSIEKCIVPIIDAYSDDDNLELYIKSIIVFSALEYDSAEDRNFKAMYNSGISKKYDSAYAKAQDVFFETVYTSLSNAIDRLLESDDKELNQKYIDTIKAMIKKGGYIGE